MADRTDREGRWTPDDRIRLLEDDVDQLHALIARQQAELTAERSEWHSDLGKLKGSLIGILVMLATAAVMLAVNLAVR